VGVINGQAVSAEITNPAFLDANADDVAIGVIGFQNTATASGSNIDNIQREANSLNSFVGSSVNSAKNQKPIYTNDQGFTANDDLKTRLDSVSGKFNTTTGHTHGGSPGDGAPIQSTSIASVSYRGYFIQGTDLSGISGLSTDVSSYLVGHTPSSNSTTLGTVVNDPVNRVILRHSDGTNINDPIIDGLGNQVYGRLTYSASVWTLTFYVLIVGTETAYSMPIEGIRWYYQELYNPIAGAPVYSELAVTPSDNAAATIPYASETVEGKVLFANSAPPAISSTSAKGTGTRSAKDDHTHEGLHSLGITGSGTTIKGDAVLEGGLGVTLSLAGQKITINTGSIAYQETPAGLINGTNLTFGPLSFVPSSASSILVLVDSIVVPNTEWSLVGFSIVFNSGSQPRLGQSIYCFYLGGGTPITPPPPTGILKTDFITITGTDITNGYAVLSATPADVTSALVDHIGGTSQQYLVDYSIASNHLVFSGLGMAAFLVTGSKIRVHYIT
jgi:hypothetical protein